MIGLLAGTTQRSSSRLEHICDGCWSCMRSFRDSFFFTGNRQAGFSLSVSLISMPDTYIREA